MIEHDGVDGVFFTGGTATGRQVAKTTAPSFKKLSLELGGKNPTLVFADCDFDATLNGVMRASFANQGQVCLCGSRILIERPIFARFRDAMVERAKALEIGDPASPDTELGALISDEHRQKVEGYLEFAKKDGGTIHCGGTRPSLPSPLDKGFFLEPAVISDLAPTCRTAMEEVFGPVVTLHPFDKEEEAIEIANGVRYGLCASVWTSDLARAHRVGGALDVGMVWVNTWLNRDLRTPFGGMKDSGIGREGGRHSLEFYSETKNLCIEY